MTVLPEKIKQDGYNATRRGENYIVEYISGGHIPQEESINLTIEEMKVIYNNPDKWNDIIVQARSREDKEKKL